MTQVYTHNLSINSIPKMQSLMAHRLSLIFIGMLYPLGFSPIDYWPLTIISLLLLLNEVFVRAGMLNSHQEKKIKKQLTLFSVGLYWGIGAFGVGVSWVYVSIHEFGHAPIIGAVAISSLFVLVLSIVKAFGFLLIERLIKKLGTGLFILIIPFCWVLFDFVQTFIFSGFPWLFAGYTQIDAPLSMLSTWFGVYGVSWFMLAIISCVVIIIRILFYEKRQKQLINSQKEAVISQLSIRGVFIIFMVLLSVPFLASVIKSEKVLSSKKTLKVALVQPNIPQERKWDRQFFSQIIDILYQQSEAHWNADLIVWPEGAIPAYKHQVEDIIDDLNKQAKKTDTDLLLGLPVYESSQKISYAALIALGNHQQTYHKQVLVPFGEYVPLGKLLRGVIEFLNMPMSSFSPATAEQKIMSFTGYDVIPAICYEIAYPSIIHGLIARSDNLSPIQPMAKPKLLVTVSNDAWFGDSFGPYQHMQIARMRALELGIPLVRSTNDGITAVVDAKGQLLKSLNRYTQATLNYSVPLVSYKTPYRQFGLLGVYCLLILSLVIFIIKFSLSTRTSS